MEEKMMAKRITTVSQDIPLIVADASQPMEYDTIYFEPGGYVELRCGTKFTINHLIPKDAENGQSKMAAAGSGYDIIVTGAEGEDGGDGAPGAQGKSGKPGKPGSDGRGCPMMHLIIKDAQKDVVILNQGGKGGAGGAGGDGGNGSSKGYGGDGGDGGTGGNGGSGCELTIEWNSSNGSSLCSQDEFSEIGIGGQGGTAGVNGEEYTGSKIPKDGDKGNNGIKGNKGRTTIKLWKED